MILTHMTIIGNDKISQTHTKITTVTKEKERGETYTFWKRQSGRRGSNNGKTSE